MRKRFIIPSQKAACSYIVKFLKTFYLNSLIFYSERESERLETDHSENNQYVES